MITHNGGATIRVIAGTVDGVTGPISGIAAEPTYLDVSLPSGGSFVHVIPRGHSAFAYVFEGVALFGDNLVAAPKLAVLDDGDSVEVRAETKPARFLLVSGKPLNEPIARHGPFVMNTREEIEETLRTARRNVREIRLDTQESIDANDSGGKRSRFPPGLADKMVC